MNKKEMIDNLIIDNIRFNDNGRMDIKYMNESIKIIIFSLMNKYSFVYGSDKIARDEVIASLYEALITLSNKMEIDFNNEDFRAILYTATNHNVINHMFNSKREFEPEVHIEDIDEYKTIEDLKDESYELRNNHSEYSIWLDNYKNVILTEKNITYLYNRNGGTSTKYSESEEPTIKNRILKALGNKDPRQENIKYQIKRIERILESNDFINDLKANLDNIDITDISLDTRKAFNKNNSLTNRQLKELRVYLFKELDKLNQQIDDKFNTPDIIEDYHRTSNYRIDTEPFICINDGNEYIDKRKFAEEHNMTCNSVRNAILRSTKTSRPYQVKGYFLISKSQYDPDKDYSKYMNNKPLTIKKIKCVTTGETFDTIAEAGNKYKVSQPHISECCKGKRKSAGKHPQTGERMIWMYLDHYNKTI